MVHGVYRGIIKKIIKIVRMWITNDVRVDKDQSWINALIKKIGINTEAIVDTTNNHTTIKIN